MTFNAMIRKAVAGSYYVEHDGIVYECRARGVFRNENVTPLVGDTAVVQVDERDSENEGVICKIIQRKNSFTRPPIANLDKLFIVASVQQPIPNRLVIDKLITVCEYKDIEPVIVFTKIDLQSARNFADIYIKAGFKTLEVSNVADSDFSMLEKELSGCITAFAGNTGVGKSSLLNNLFPGLILKTGEVSQKLGRGRHTTRHTELYEIKELSAFVADTPGFGSMELSQYDIIKKEFLGDCFREFAPYLGKCKFTGCSHTVEKGCAVLEAVQAGEISPLRHESYCILYNEAKQIKEWELKHN